MVFVMPAFILGVLPTLFFDGVLASPFYVVPLPFDVFFAIGRVFVVLGVLLAVLEVLVVLFPLVAVLAILGVLAVLFAIYEVVAFLLPLPLDRVLVLDRVLAVHGVLAFHVHCVLMEF